MHELLQHLSFCLRSLLDNYSAKLQGVAEGKTRHNNTEIHDCKSHGNEKQGLEISANGSENVTIYQAK